MTAERTLTLINYDDSTSQSEELYRVDIQPVRAGGLTRRKSTNHTVRTRFGNQGRVQIPVLYIVGLFVALCWWHIYYRTASKTADPASARSYSRRHINDRKTGRYDRDRQEAVRPGVEDLCAGKSSNDETSVEEGTHTSLSESLRASQVQG